MKLKWAVVGTGYIANTFAEAHKAADAGELFAVCGSSGAKAEAFAAKHGFARHFGDFGKMLDAIVAETGGENSANSKNRALYVATPNLLHFDEVMLALERGVNVLCEKPMAANALQFEKLMKAAREKNLFLMEAMWTRCFPAVAKVREWIAAGRIGRVSSVRAEFCLKAVENWQGWKASALYGGGALRDVGIYSLAWAFLAYTGERPESVVSSYILKDGADLHFESLLKYAGGRSAFCTGGFDMVSSHEAAIYGDKGFIIIGPQMWHPKKAALYRYSSDYEFGSEEVEVFSDGYEGSGMQYEIAHAAECIARGKTESPLYTLEESLSITKLIDSLRAEWGVKFPGE